MTVSVLHRADPSHRGGTSTQGAHAGDQDLAASPKKPSRRWYFSQERRRDGFAIDGTDPSPVAPAIVTGLNTASA
jgi:hypothetical protein